MAKEYTPFKMKGSPMQRNFGIGDDSPLEQRPAATITGFPVKTKKQKEADKLERARKRRERRQWLYKKTGWKVFDY